MSKIVLLRREFLFRSYEHTRFVNKGLKMRGSKKKKKFTTLTTAHSNAVSIIFNTLGTI